MIDFMINAFYALCGVVCIALAIVIIYATVASIIRNVRKGRRR